VAARLGGSWKFTAKRNTKARRVVSGRGEKALLMRVGANEKII